MSHWVKKPLFLSLCIGILFYPFASDAKDLGRDFINSPWKVTSDRLTYDREILILEGDVEIINKDERLTADYIAANTATKEVEAKGNVRFETKEGTLTGKTLKLHFGDGTGKIQGGKLSFTQDNIYLSGDTIEKTGEDTYHITNGSITTCDGETPPWRLVAKDIKVTIGEYAQVKHATFQVKSFPCMYIPYLMFPTGKRKRKTGFLIPRYDQSDRDGFGLDIPFYWAVGENNDITFYQHYMSKRGFMEGVEYRYILNRESKGNIKFDYLSDKKDGSEFDQDGFIRTNKNRWWVRGKFNQALPGGSALKVDLDLLSDEDYLREFRRSYSTFDASQEAFLEQFGRGLDEETSFIRKSAISLNKSWQKFSLNGECRYNQNLDKSQNEFTLHKLPFVELSRSKQRIFNSPLLAELNSSYTNYRRNVGTTGHRLNIHPRLNLPLRLGNYLNFIPSVGFRETVYIVDEGGTNNDFKSRERFGFRSELSTNFSRIFNIKGKRGRKFRHTIQPKVIYEYTFDRNPQTLPQFDEEDTVTGRNIIRYSITNYLIGKAVDDEDQVDYQEFLRLSLSQGYDINRMFLDRSFSDIVGELEFTPLYHNIIFDLDTSWSPYDNKFTSYNVRTHLLDKRGDSLNLDYRYENGSYKIKVHPGSPIDQGFRHTDGNNVKEFNADGILKISDTLSFLGGYRRSLTADRNVETRFGLSYKAPCWGMNLHYIDEYNDQRFILTFSLAGIGEFRF